MTPPPRATYRLQFHKDFTFDAACAIVPYLARLGVSHLYASPIQKARPGSTHGYDIVDHAAINPELGGEDGFLRLSATLRQHGLGLILDIVPNHMGVGGADNGWWLSVLEWGELSRHAVAFDIDWLRLGAGGKLVLPFLGERYGIALEAGQLRLAFDPQDGSFSIWHFEHRFPMSPLSYPIVLDRAMAAVDSPERQSEVIAVSDRLRNMAEEASPERRAAFPEEAEELKTRLAQAAASPDLARAIDHAVSLINGVPDLPESFGTLHRILEMQAYRPVHWRVASSDINYRRFFDINTLAGIRVEEPEVFRLTHEMIFRLVREGHVHGLRIDHIDGLADPEGYARALQDEIGPGFYVVVEKILEPGEVLRPWPIAGTTGYDALNLIDGVFVARDNARRFERLYREFGGLEGGYGTLLREAKTDTLETGFASELEVLVSDLKRIADADRRTRDYTTFAIRRALAEIVARFPVYRTYLGDEEPSGEDRQMIERTVAAAKRWSALPDRSVHDFAASVLLGAIEADAPGRPEPADIARFRRRFQQLTGPVMAKSLEDTLFYRYARLISLNEVGGDPDHFGGTVEAFHHGNAERAAHWPNAMIATATHDTKRGEDSRARLAALSEMEGDWEHALQTWRRSVEPHLSDVEGAEAPDANDEIMLLQALLGAWPLDLLDDAADDALASFRERIEAYLLKALREAKRYTSWVNPDEGYENAATRLVRGVLASDSAFLREARPLARRLAWFGMLNGLGRTVLKCTLPGVPDIYQGTEFWDLSLVDPDNRRPVDYGAREAALGDTTSLTDLLRTWPDGRIKQRIVKRLLADRAAHPALYAERGYEPLHAEGALAGHVVAFRRTHGDEERVVVVSRLLTGFTREGALPDADSWADTGLALPPGKWRNILTGADVATADVANEGSRLSVAALFADLPVAVLGRGR